MKKLLLLTGVFLFTHSFTQAQIDAGNDTVICNQAPVTLQALVTGNYGTSSYSFENIPYAPEAYTGTAVTLSDDAVSAALPIGFTFCFLGNNYTQFYIGSNGWVSFSPGQSTAYTSAIIPNTAAAVPKNCIMGPWEDWHPGLCAGNCIYYQTIGTAPNRKLVVSWDNVPMFQCTTTLGTFQIVCHETTGIIENHLTNKPNCPTWAGGTGTEGVHNDAGTLAFVAPGRNSTQWTTANESVRFVPSGVDWFQGPTLIGQGDTIVVTPGSTTEYHAQVTLCDGNVYTDSVTVTIGAGLTFSPTVTTTGCAVNTGQATVVPNNSSGPFSYQWDDPGLQTTQTAIGLGPGTYTVTVYDSAIGCTTDTTITIVTNNTVLATVPTSVNVTCNGGADGVADAFGTGGTGGTYTYLWDDPLAQTTQSATGLPTGSYNVIITDSLGCADTATIFINEPLAVSLSASGIDVLCNGSTTGSATVVPSGGNGSPYTYVWDDASAQTTQTATGLGAGTYQVIVTDQLGCTETVSVTITEPTGMTTSFTSSDVLCNGGNDGSATVNVSGGVTPYTYSWPLSGNTTATEGSLFAGTYTVEVTDANGCMVVDTVIISQPNPLTLAGITTDATCGLSDGSATATPSSGTSPYTYQWGASAGNQTSQTASNIPSGTHTVIVTDANGCTGSTTVVVNEVLDVSASFNATPSQGIAPLDVLFNNTSTNGSTYFWDFGNGNTSTSANPSAETYILPGTYTVMLIAYNAGGCSDTAWVDILVTNQSLLIVPNVFSPNGDGVNDIFTVTHEAIATFTCIIKNRWGQPVYEYNDVTGSWNGKHESNNKEAKEGTYYYIITATGVDEEEYSLSGSLTLVR
jgi:gliding motility-associated-like protein